MSVVTYLAGPINGCTDAECKDWRGEVSQQLPGAVDPMVRDYRGRELEPGIAAEIVELDKADIDRCDVVLVNYSRPSVGTSMEVLYGWERGKRVVVWCPQGAALSPWLTYHCHAVVHSLAAAVEECRRHDGGLV